MLSRQLTNFRTLRGVGWGKLSLLLVSVISTPALAENAILGGIVNASQCAVDVALLCGTGGAGVAVSATVRIGGQVLDVSGAVQCAYDRGAANPSEPGSGIANVISNEIVQSCLSNLPIPLLACATIASDLISGLADAVANSVCRAPPVVMCTSNCEQCCKEGTRANIFARKGDYKAYSVCLYRCNCPQGHNVPPGYYVPWGGRMTQPCNGQYRTFTLGR